MNASRKVRGQVSEQPLVAILRNLGHALSRLNSATTQASRQAADFLRQIVPRHRGRLCVAGCGQNQRRLITAAVHTIAKQFDERSRLDRHVNFRRWNPTGAHTRSKTVAMPWPTPMHMVAIPVEAFRSSML